ncbi:Protein of unknown function [Pyronema omphalodes CBS 100304]|uniref:Uncharacterized protein n=1 Tax=Pyronema omphalodes (strain CBS 100304) TaxID=1076935 RepID=U4LV18_PYROM|nr:Protein of unknown function [Pyronema omphalodes CBS 100304]
MEATAAKAPAAHAAMEVGDGSVPTALVSSDDGLVNFLVLSTAADSERSGALSIVVHIAAFSTTSTARPMMASATPPALACDLPLTVVRSL